MIKRLRLKGFRRYVDDAWTFDAGVCFVSGKNNAGKTSLFLAIEYALFGARSPAALMRPGVPSMGVELVFEGRDQKTYKLQRLHAKPPRARSKVDGHFTLKEIVGPDDERYLLSSDFQDHEEALAKKLLEITGVSRRVFELAVHVRQGEIAQILDGDAKLDIALGITAAGTANEEMRALALLDERAAELLPAMQASRAHIKTERKTSAADEAGLAKERAKHEKTIAEQSQRAGQGSDKLEALARDVDALGGAVRSLDRADDDLARARAHHSDVERQLAAAANPAPDAAADPIDPVELRADLRARIRRADAELASGAPTCSCCAQPIARAALETHVTAWRRELGDIDVRAAEAEARAAARAERARLAATLDAAQRTVDAAQAARDNVVATLARVLGDGADSRAELAKRTQALQDARVAHAAEGAKAEALLAAAEDALAEVEDRIARHASRAARLEREEARLATVLDVLEKRRARAEELRSLAAAFKQLQEELRTSAAAELSAETLRIHRALSVDDELAELRIDPARYQVYVRARDHDAEAPASLVQGGGHRLLLGLAFRLALVARLGPFPFVLLDEPTYGLDERHRAALLERITRLGLTTQILLITHQAMGDAAEGRTQQIVIERPGSTADAGSAA